MSVLIIVAAALWGGLIFRVRGGLWTARNPLGTTGTRIIVWGGGMAALAAVLGYGWLSLAMIPAMWLGSVFGWNNSIDLGHNEGTLRGDILTMLWRGPLWTMPGALVAVVTSIPGAAGLLLAGLLCGPCYYTAWQGVRYIAPGFTRGPEMGEALFGATIGALFAGATLLF